MDRENSLTSLLPEWGSNPIPSDPQSASNRLRHRLGTEKKNPANDREKKQETEKRRNCKMQMIGKRNKTQTKGEKIKILDYVECPVVSVH
jgi:hypothetical protein